MLTEVPLSLCPVALGGERVTEEPVVQVRLVEVEDIEDEVAAHQEEGAQRHAQPAEGFAPPPTDEVHESSERQQCDETCLERRGQAMR